MDKGKEHKQGGAGAGVSPPPTPTQGQAPGKTGGHVIVPASGQESGKHLTKTVVTAGGRVSAPMPIIVVDKPSAPVAAPAAKPAGLTVIQPEDWAVPRGYSNGMLAPVGRRLLTVAGQIGWGPDGHMVEPPPGEDRFVCQFAQALHNVVTIVKAAGGKASDLMSLRIFVTDKRRYLQHTKAVGAAYRALFGDHYPSMALVQVSDLVEDGALVEIEALAAVP